MFLPHKEVFLLNPVMGFLRDSKIKIEDNQCENQTHFAVCKTRQGQLSSIGPKSQNLLSTQAVPWSNMERLQYFAPIIRKIRMPQESLGVIGICFLEILFTSIERPLMNGNISLVFTISRSRLTKRKFLIAHIFWYHISYNCRSTGRADPRQPICYRRIHA